MNKNKILLCTLCGALAQNAVATDDKFDRNHPNRMLKPGDPLVYQQWNLLNTGQSAFAESGGVPGMDLNLWRTHKKGIMGEGITIAVVDDGLEIKHPNLAANIKRGSMNMLDHSDDPTPAKDDINAAHGTSVAGIAAGVGFNNLGNRGVAPNAGLKGFNWLKRQDLEYWLISHGVGWRTEDVRVFNQSYGSTPIFNPEYNPEKYPTQFIYDSVYQDVTLNSHRKKGALFVKSAGNGYKKTTTSLNGKRYDVMPANFESERPNKGLPWQNSNLTVDNANYWNMVISALNADGVLSSYSSVGSNVFLTAPGGEYGKKKPAHVTTDLTSCYRGYNTYAKADDNGLHGGTVMAPNCNYNGRMNGTSSAAPNASGAVALIMSEFPELGQRDIRHILASTATKVDPDYSDITLSVNGNKITALEGWSTNAAGYDYSPYYGFGLIDVDRAMKMAKKAEKLPALKVTNWSTKTPGAKIPMDGSQPGKDAIWVKKNLIVESVQVKVDIDHERISDLLIELVSPSGTRSILMSPRNNMVGRSLYEEEGIAFKADEGRGYRNQLLLTHKFYGEKATGDWQLLVTDTSDKDRKWALRNKEDHSDIKKIKWPANTKAGVLNHWSIRVFGHKSA